MKKRWKLWASLALLLAVGIYLFYRPVPMIRPDPRDETVVGLLPVHEECADGRHIDPHP